MEERAVLEALVAGKTQREAAELVGVSRRTVQYWVKRPAFLEAMEARKLALWRETAPGRMPNVQCPISNCVFHPI